MRRVHAGLGGQASAGSRMHNAPMLWYLMMKNLTLARLSMAFNTVATTVAAAWRLLLRHRPK